MPRFATKPGSGLGLGGRSSTLKTAAAAVGFTLVVVYMLQYVQVDVHQLAKKQTPSGTLSSGAILAGAVMAGGLSAAEQAVIAANSSADVFAGPTLDLSRLPTLFTLLTDYPEENTWPSVPLEAAAGDVSAANATANATAAA
ncbi:hypothetical protein D9Q98_005677 [Chlorella vulgaris]|uniref:Uncharacterized protein n=1 Tax=Chlorella vulgaris TaxID=3077 RepID=A0A9D4YW61_CHLVU|nr:hypothetical protein D9Q98_005677 [Chlorella vulgaris]